MPSDTTDTPNETNTKAIKEMNTNPCLVLLISPNTNLHWRSLVTERNSYGVNRTIYDFKNENIHTFNSFNSNNRSQTKIKLKKINRPAHGQKLFLYEYPALDPCPACCSVPVEEGRNITLK